jgi:hypothetical protein
VDSALLRPVTVVATVVITLAACTSGDASNGSAEEPSPPGPTSSTPASTEAAGAETAGVVDPTLERPDDLDTLQQFLFDGMATDLQKAADELERGEDPTFSCASVLAYAEEGRTAGLEAAAQKAEEQCGREIPIAWATRQLDAVEATGDLAQSVGECASALATLDLVEERHTDSRVTALQARADQLCS